MRKKETPNPSRMRGRGVEVSETLFYMLKYKYQFILGGMNMKIGVTEISPRYVQQVAEKKIQRRVLLL